MDQDIHVQVGAYILGITIPLALFGNILTIFIFHKGTACKATQSSIYFKALAVADIYVLLFPGLELFLYNLNTEWEYAAKHNVACKIAIFNVYFAVEVSAWITVAVTIDRTLCVCFPLNYMNRSVKSIYIKFLAIGVFFAFCNVYALIYSDVIEEMTYEYTGNSSGNTTIVYAYCGAAHDDVFIHDLLGSLNMSIFIFGLPLIINVTCNTLLLRKLYRRMSKFQSSELTDAQIASRRSVANSVTYRAIAISTVHILSTGPFAVIHIYFYIVNWIVSDTLAQTADILNVLYYMNSAVNFLLYCATGTDFRSDLAAILRRKRRIRN